MKKSVIKRSRRFERLLRTAPLILFLLILTGCGSVYIRGENEIKRVDGGWLISDSALLDLMECCGDKLDKPE